MNKKSEDLDAKYPILLGFQVPHDDEDLDDKTGDLPLNQLGGIPRWLNPGAPLEYTAALCGTCNKRMVLLLQLYIPEATGSEAFHRVLYVFCCKDALCLGRGQANCFKVFRSQLGEENEYYSKDNYLLNEGANIKETCEICGFYADIQCSRCKLTPYCSEEHMRLDWGVGNHSQTCGKTGKHPQTKTIMNLGFNMSGIVSEEEQDSSEFISEKTIPKDYQKYISKKFDTTAKSDEKYEKMDKKEVDKTFLSFTRTISRDPDQILRYVRTLPNLDADPGEPLWISSYNKPPKDFPPRCELCGAKRIFEFQILPQVLNYLGMDPGHLFASEMGVLIIYTCSRNCGISNRHVALVPEVLWHQTVK